MYGLARVSGVIPNRGIYYNSISQAPQWADFCYIAYVDWLLNRFSFTAYRRSVWRHTSIRSRSKLRLLFNAKIHLYRFFVRRAIHHLIIRATVVTDKVKGPYLQCEPSHIAQPTFIANKI